MTLDELIKALKLVRKDIKKYKAERQSIHDDFFENYPDHHCYKETNKAEYAGDENTNGGNFRVGNIIINIVEARELQ